LPFFGWSILLRMSLAWDSRAAKLEGFGGGGVSSFAFLPFFLPPSFTLGTFGGFGALGILGGFGGLGGLGGLVAFFLGVFSGVGEGTLPGDSGSSGSECVEGGCSTGTLALLGSLLMALVAFWRHNAKSSVNEGTFRGFSLTEY